MSAPTSATPGHGDHWLAALPQDDPRLREVLEVPLDAGEGIRLHRHELTAALDMVQVTRGRRLLTSYPEPRATGLLRLEPRELALWETRVEAWLTAVHEDAGALTFFLTDFADAHTRYAGAGKRAGLPLEAAGLAYALDVAPTKGTPRLVPAAKHDARFLPDDYWFEAQVVDVQAAGENEVLDLLFHNGVAFPVTKQGPSGAKAGDHVKGFLWLTGRLPQGH